MGCDNYKIKKDDVILLVPVYGQSLALGEEAKLITNFDTMAVKYNHKILTENLNERFGFFSNTILKQKIKNLINDRKRTSENSSYGLGEYIARLWIANGVNDSLISVFIEGQGNTGIDYLGTNSEPYKKLINEIKNAYNIASERGCKLVVPAFCWLQGENDITHNTGKGYKQKLQCFRNQLDKDVKQITHQNQNVKCILYQSCCLSLSENRFNKLSYACPQMDVPQAQMELIRDDGNFCASGPTYPYSIVREYVHLDGISQKKMGYLEGISLRKVLRNQKSKGVTPSKFTVSGNIVDITINVEYPPLSFDTTQVKYVNNYGFSIINHENKDILKCVSLEKNHVILSCFSSPKGCKVRYGVNGDYWKSGNQRGPRGNLRDSQGDKYKCIIQGKQYRIDNWGYIFEHKI